MKLNDLFAMAGDHQLSTMTWGASAIILANEKLTETQKITLSCTGKEAHAKLRDLPFQTLVQLLTQDIQVVGDQVSFVGTVSQPAAGVPVTVPNNGPKMNPMALILVIVASIITLMFAWSSMEASKQTGAPPENQTVHAILKTMTELVKDESKPKSDPPAESN